MVATSGRETPLAGSKQPTHVVETAALHDQAMSDPAGSTPAGARVVALRPSTQDTRSTHGAVEVGIVGVWNGRADGWAG
jgi:hypothetical protein